MNNFQKRQANPSGTDLNPGDFPIGSPESRAAARARTMVPKQIKVVVFKKPNGVYGGELCDSDRCTVGGKDYFRLPEESMDEFQDRVIKIQPPTSTATLLVMHPTEAA
jgi:hypothetical protein